MLRRALKKQAVSVEASEDGDHKKEKKNVSDVENVDRESEGKRRKKEKNEEALEKLVLGGEEDFIEQLTSSSSIKTDKKKKKSRKRKYVGTTLFEGEEYQAAWEDELDGCETIELTDRPKHKGMKEAGERIITGNVYTQRLKQQFERVNATPDWADLDRVMEDSDDDSDVDELLHTTGNFLSSSTALPSGTLQIKKCSNLNSDSPTQARLTGLAFHPTAQVALTAAKGDPFTLFQVDGKTNPKIQSVYIERFPIMAAQFSRNGEEVIAGSHYPTFTFYDMMAGRLVKVAKIRGMNDDHTSLFKVSPDGRFIVFLGRHGTMHLVSAKTKELIESIKMNGSVEDVTFTRDGKYMYSFGSDGQVYVWEMETRSCVHRFYDDGCIKGTSIAASPNGQYLVCGSYSGVVNIYEREKCHLVLDPRPIKSVMNLKTPCTSSVFNPSSEILAISSRYAEKAAKLVHLPSFQVFSNYPDLLDKNLRIPQLTAFSTNSGYFSLANNAGTALLYRLKHYGNY